MSHLASEVQSIFDDLQQEVYDSMELAFLYHGKERYDREKRDRAENWLIDQDRKRSQCRYVKEREAVDPEYRESRRELSRLLARETTARREDEAVREWNKTAALPGLVPERDFPVPKKRSYHFHVDIVELRKRHAAQEKERRRKAKRHDSMPILEVIGNAGQ